VQVRAAFRAPIPPTERTRAQPSRSIVNRRSVRTPGDERLVFDESWRSSR
jgi:hypothetical protein